MTQGKDKYSLWLVPGGDAGRQLQALVNKLSEHYQAPLFVPHLTLVANIFADSTDLDGTKKRIAELSASFGSFPLALSSYGFKNEEFRSLYVLAHSPELDEVYRKTAAVFPQVNDEHFRAMPHLSVLYGNYSPEIKQQIIHDNPLPAAECSIESFDLYLTNDPISTWRLEQVFPLPGQG